MAVIAVVGIDKRRLQTACRCRLKLPATCYMIQRQPPLSLSLLPDQSLSGCDPDRAGSSEVNRKFR